MAHIPETHLTKCNPFEHPNSTFGRMLIYAILWRISLFLCPWTELVASSKWVEVKGQLLENALPDL